MAKRRSRITYAPKSRRRSRASDRSQSAVESNVPRIKETDVLPSTSQEKVISWFILHYSVTEGAYFFHFKPLKFLVNNFEDLKLTS